jgi:hypothetical protein
MQRQKRKSENKLKNWIRLGGNEKQKRQFFCIFLGDLECVRHSLAYVAHFVFWTDV